MMVYESMEACIYVCTCANSSIHRLSHPIPCTARSTWCYTIKCNTVECGRMELITCWKITRVGKKANPALRVNPSYNG
jgi:hypothetical protein